MGLSCRETIVSIGARRAKLPPRLHFKEQKPFLHYISLFTEVYFARDALHSNFKEVIGNLNLKFTENQH